MGFNFNNVLSGVAKAGSSYLDSKTADRKEERNSVDSQLSEHMGSMASRAFEVKTTRAKKKRGLQQIMQDFQSVDSNLEQGQLEYIAGLSEERRTALMSTATSPILKQRGQTLSDVITLVDDESEFDDTGTLMDRMEGAVVAAPMDYSAYYTPTDNMSDMDVDAAAEKIAKQYSNLTGISMDKLKGYATRSFSEVQNNRYKIEYVEEDTRKLMQLELDAAHLLKARLEGARGAIQTTDVVSKSMLANVESIKGQFFDAKPRVEQTRLIGDQGKLDFQKEFISSPAYREAVTREIRNTVKTAMENPKLKDSYLAAVNRAFPNVYGGLAGSDASVLENNALYWAEGADGVSEVMFGKNIKKLEYNEGIGGGPKRRNNKNTALPKPEAVTGIPLVKKNAEDTDEVKTKKGVKLPSWLEEKKQAEETQLADLDSQIAALEAMLKGDDESESQEDLELSAEIAASEGDDARAEEIRSDLKELQESLIEKANERMDLIQDSKFLDKPKDTKRKGMMNKRTVPMTFKNMFSDDAKFGGLASISLSKTPIKDWLTQSRTSREIISGIEKRASKALVSKDAGVIGFVLKQAKSLTSNKDFDAQQQRELKNVIDQLLKAQEEGATSNGT
tara:strand:- start:4963 stop:6819 length:1857 start_codon:yes stop_codon:yes gene_type:complete